MIAAHDVVVRAPEQGTRPEAVLQGCRPGGARSHAHRDRNRRDGLGGDHAPAIRRCLRSPGDALARTTYTTAHPAPWGWMVDGLPGDEGDRGGRAAGRGSLRGARPCRRAGRRRSHACGPRRRVHGVDRGPARRRPEAAATLPVPPDTAELVLLAGARCGRARRLRARRPRRGSCPDWPAASARCRCSPLPGALAAAAAAGYTAALFAQCEGRDLWQTPLLLPDLLAQAVIAGAAAFGLADLVLAIPEPDAIRWALLGGLWLISRW